MSLSTYFGWINTARICLVSNVVNFNVKKKINKNKFHCQFAAALFDVLLKIWMLRTQFCLPTGYQLQWTNISWAIIQLRKWRRSTRNCWIERSIRLRKPMVLIWIVPMRIQVDRFFGVFYENVGPKMNQAARQLTQTTSPLFQICMIH